MVVGSDYHRAFTFRRFDILFPGERRGAVYLHIILKEHMLITLVLNLIIGITAYLLVSRIFNFKGLTSSIIAFAILYTGQIVFSELLLGVFGLLRLDFVLMLNALFLLAAGCTVKIFGMRKVNPLDERLKSFISGSYLSKSVMICFSVLIGFMVVKVLVNLFNPPFGWDSLNYHFTFAVEWLKHGNLSVPIVVSDDPFPTYYPINGSLLFFWLMIPFKSGFLADVGQLPFFILSLVSIVSIARSLGLSREYSFLTACLFGMIPNVFKQLQIGYVDIMVGAIFLAAVSFLLRLSERFGLKDVFMFCFSLGILIGIKITVLAYSVFILIPFFYLLFTRKDCFLQVKVGYFFLLLFLLSVFGGFSYFRNFMLTGNPFYPLEILAMGKTLLGGVIDKATFTARNVSGQYSLAKLLFHEGLGAQAILFIIPGVILALPVNIIKRRKKDFFSNYIMLLPVLLYLVYRFILPIPNSRYLYPMLGLGMIAGFSAFYYLKVPLKAIRISSILIIIASASECARGPELAGSFILAFIIFGILLNRKKLRLPLPRAPVLITGAILITIILQLMFYDYRKNEYSRYIKNSRYWPDATAAWAWLNNNTHGDNIAYVGRPVPYPLYGTDFKNNVYYVSVNSIDPIKLHYLKYSRYRWDSDAENMHKSFREPNNYRGHADYPVWLNNLQKRKTDFLFIYSLHHTKGIKFPIEESWASIHPDKFVPVFNNPTVRIYKIIK